MPKYRITVARETVYLETTDIIIEADTDKQAELLFLSNISSFSSEKWQLCDKTEENLFAEAIDEIEICDCGAHKKQHNVKNKSKNSPFYSPDIQALGGILAR